MAKNKNGQKAQRESLNIKDKLLETLKASVPEVFSEGRVNWDKIRLALGERLEAAPEKFNFTWAGKAGAVTNVLIPSKATLRPDKKESVKFETSENLFIEGDNLEVLKLLQKPYFEKVKMIYIDPPYNTGNDFVYKDDFRQPLKNYLEQSGQVDNDGNRLSTNTQASGRFHSDWLNMMYPRLKLAWNLLRHDGVILISIDGNEIHHLRMVLDEMFGEENYVETFVWRSRLGKGATAEQTATIHEYILCYSKEFSNLRLLADQRTLKNEGKERLRQWGQGDRREDRPTMYYAVKSKDYGDVYPIKPDGSAGRWRVSKENFEKLLAKGLVQFEKQTNKRIEAYRIIPAGTVTQTAQDSILDPEITKTTAHGTKELSELFGFKIFDYPKPASLLKFLINICTVDGDIVMDFFAGSGITAHAVLAQNQEDGGKRKFILVQMPELTEPKSEAYKAGYKTIADIAKERIRRVIKGYGDHKPIDDGFKVFKLGPSNYYDNLFEYDPDKTAEENDKAFNDYLNKAQNELFPVKINEIDIVYENIIKEGLSLNARIDEIKIGKNKVYKAADSERELLICLDEKISAGTIDALTDKEYKEKIFICFDAALTDSDKANLGFNLALKTI